MHASPDLLSLPDRDPVPLDPLDEVFFVEIEAETMSRILSLILLGLLLCVPATPALAAEAAVPVPTWWWRDRCLGCNEFCLQGMYDCPCWKYVWVNTGS